MNKRKTCRVLLTTECNLSCSYCCNKLPKVQKTIKFTTMDEFVELAKNYETINISGGEPLMAYCKLNNLLRKIEKLNCRIYLYTNGYCCDTAESIGHRIDGVSIGCHDDKMFAITAAKQWRKYNRNVRFCIQDIKSTESLEEGLSFEGIQLVTWKMNDCDNDDEDRFII